MLRERNVLSYYLALENLRAWQDQIREGTEKLRSVDVTVLRQRNVLFLECNEFSNVDLEDRDAKFSIFVTILYFSLFFLFFLTLQSLPSQLSVVIARK